MTDPDVQERLEYLRSQIEAEQISYSELAELADLAEYIEPGDVVLLEWAGVPEKEVEVDEMDFDNLSYQDLQELIDNGQAWHLEGAIGRAAMAAIEDGYCVLGLVGHRDYWHNYIPSRFEVEPGTKGSVEYAEAKDAER